MVLRGPSWMKKVFPPAFVDRPNYNLAKVFFVALRGPSWIKKVFSPSWPFVWIKKMHRPNYDLAKVFFVALLYNTSYAVANIRQRDLLDAAPISELEATPPAVAASPPTSARSDPPEFDSLSVPVQASDAPIITDDETPRLTEYVLPRYISGACEQKAQAIVDSVFSNFLLVNLEVGGAGGGGALEQGPTPPHPVPSLAKYETCMWRCYPKSIPGTCGDPERVCTIVAGGAASGVAGAACGRVGGSAAAGICGAAAAPAATKVCKTVLKQRICYDSDPCGERRRECKPYCWSAAVDNVTFMPIFEQEL